jgi:Flp pilus assembly protein TadB
MEISTLKTYRKIVPGGTFLICLIPLLWFAYDFAIKDILELTTGQYGAISALCTISAFVVGALFNNLNIRSVINAKSHARIVGNIKEQLMRNGLTKEVSPEERDVVRSSERLMHVFYQFIDNDKSLSEKARLVRDNGLVWTSAADIAIVTLFFCIIYLILIAYFGLNSILVFAFVLTLLVAAFLIWVVHPNAESQQIALSNDQIEFIVTHKKQELQNKVNGLFD